MNTDKIKEYSFRFCGKEIKQFEDKSILVTCTEATDTIGEVKFSSKGRRPEDKANESEAAQMRSVVGSLGWVARQCRPYLSYAVSAGQGAVCRATVKDLKLINEALAQAKKHSKAGSWFEAGAISWDTAIVVTVSEASFAQERVQEADGTEKPHRTEQAFSNLLADPCITKQSSAKCQIWCWRSLTDKRVCRATLQGEAHGMLSGTEMGDRLRAIICDLRGLSPDMREGQAISSTTMRHLWLTDCESLNPKNE